MPAYKELDDIFNSIVRREISRFNKEVYKLEREFFSTPLLDFYSCDDHYDCVIDVPYMDPTSIYMKVEGDVMKLRCKDKMGNVYQTQIQLPRDADLDNLKVERIKWFLRIRISRRLST
ncbi:hypothetical protein [Sulfuracidifex metallicus]|uniref:hypothetical protein n=1 Tax=Sulfuracidifex metallicus TaxID=47303 RepID=UPI002272D735|nr:hypothetical protein [Sulfuracidifex metallicus]MCY0850921.1 hypothetical protein [Sulfuracidifex metallicus]